MRCAGAIVARTGCSAPSHEDGTRARRIATSGASSAGVGAIALAPRSSQSPAGIASAERARAHSASAKLTKMAARGNMRRALWIVQGFLRKRRGDYLTGTSTAQTVRVMVWVSVQVAFSVDQRRARAEPRRSRACARRSVTVRASVTASIGS
jgi:hypothetical protein